MSLIGYGATLQVNDGASSAFAVIPNLTSIDPPEEVWQKVESKRLDLASQTIVRVPTLKDPGEFSFTLEADKTQVDRLTTLKNVQKNWKITVLGATSPTDDIVKTVPGKLLEVKGDPIEADKIYAIQCKVMVNGPAS